MHSFAAPTLVLAALVALPAVSAHGYVSGVVSGGKWYPGGDPSWFYQSTKPQQAGWFAKNQDNGFVAPDAYGTEDITCHIDATPGNTYVPVTAGSSIDLQWNTWPESHHGPVLTYLARCPGGDCTSVDKSKLKFFKIDEGGLISGSNTGTWADDEMIANNNTWTTTIPSGLSGNFVLRHEIIALHSAGNENGAQNYPSCINVKISGSGTQYPCRSGADCRAGTALYKSTDPGILFNLYGTFSSYKIPGPAVWSGLKKRAGLIARSFAA